ncbi:response regulator [Candidatus Woesearchaeota archaeon]|nr:response regulator [Candidatus Woesearchaeota archaeon]
MAKHVLVADDEYFLQLLFSRALKGVGYDVTVAENGIEALKSFEDLRSKGTDVGVVVTDGRMPMMGGDLLAAKLYEIDPRVRVIAVTSQDEESPIHTSLKGMRDKNVHCILPKPLADLQDLAGAVTGAYKTYDAKTTAP